MNPIDRRKHPRFEGQFKVDLLNMGDDPNISPYEAVIPATALDISRQGLRLKTAYTVRMGSLLSAIVYFKGAGSVCLCKVVWKREEMGEMTYGLFIEEWPQINPALDEKLNSMEVEEANASQPAAPSAPAVVTSFQTV
jgi:hypothetical protein